MSFRAAVLEIARLLVVILLLAAIFGSRLGHAQIALMGFSRGGQDALYASLRRFQRTHGPAAGLGFAAYLAFYPACNTTYLEDNEVADRPIRIFHGSADDYNPVAPCRSYVERLRKIGKDVQLTEYAGAHHVFDWPMLKMPMKLAEAQTTRRCRLKEGPGGRIINSDTKQPFDYNDPAPHLQHDRRQDHGTPGRGLHVGIVEPDMDRHMGTVMFYCLLFVCPAWMRV